MLQVIEGPTIEAGESLSNEVDCSAGQLVRITMPAEWTEAPLTFEFSTDGVFFNQMYGLDGFAVKVPVVVPKSGVIIPGDIGRAIAFIRFRSGHEGNPVEQKGIRNFAVTILVEGDAPEAPPASRTKSERTKSRK
jgi:hypothetical protein